MVNKEASYLSAKIAGAVVLRKARGGSIGHIVFSDGQGGTVEAHSAARGVIEGTLSERRWDFGILVPGVRYFQSDLRPVVRAGGGVIRLSLPVMRGVGIRRAQERLVALQLSPGSFVGVYGAETAHGVRTFQARHGLVADGELGPATLAALDIA